MFCIRKKVFRGNENFNKKLFLLKYSINSEKRYQNRKNFNERIFFPKYPSYLGKFNHAKRWRVACYFMKHFLIGYSKLLFKKLWTKIFKKLKFPHSSIFILKKFVKLPISFNFLKILCLSKFIHPARIVG